MLESAGEVDTASVKPEALRRTVFAGMVVAVAGVAVLTVAQVVIGWQESLTTEALRTLGYGAQLSGLALLLLVVVARPGDRVIGLSLALFTASMFMPVMQRHAAGISVVGALYLANLLLVVVLAAATLRAVTASAAPLAANR